ncbi:MAG: hypothetical protein QHH07_05200, partial [Sedimentisphaerales bacterium]|nr:hypothetical protein [Sedimentisphaerales bacterium]
MSDRIDPEVLELVNALADGQISQSERARLERLIERDPGLMKVLKQVQVLRSVVGAIGHEQAPSHIWAGVRDRIERDSLIGQP